MPPPSSPPLNPTPPKKPVLIYRHLHASRKHNGHKVPSCKHTCYLLLGLADNTPTLVLAWQINTHTNFAVQ